MFLGKLHKARFLPVLLSALDAVNKTVSGT